MNQSELIVGANEADHHFIDVQPVRDFEVDVTCDSKNIQEGDICPRCGGAISLRRGIEVGHVFKLGTRYSVAMKAGFLDENGKEQPFIMGCYGIGISRRSHPLWSRIMMNRESFGRFHCPLYGSPDCGEYEK